ncbi:hypothetical protein THAOC_35726 [Thalassiosira oceanica]|uniref:Uncharacterized protein n=1 Tax=Thalassiosira oceanica TaxID=159749 RepID=K0R0G3_THAOC|nr:hypothetical protein THAOC_35726 [Thalassiosira oceanica]|eukprot:EJK45653.1 hypothetical protein THAOC_35726 [Thalassiosira oceanica]
MMDDTPPGRRPVASPAPSGDSVHRPPGVPVSETSLMSGHPLSPSRLRVYGGRKNPLETTLEHFVGPYPVGVFGVLSLFLLESVDSVDSVDRGSQ